MKVKTMNEHIIIFLVSRGVPLKMAREHVNNLSPEMIVEIFNSTVNQKYWNFDIREFDEM